MASNTQQNEEKAKQTAQMSMKVALNDAYAALLAQAATQSFIAFTFEEALTSQIASISGPSTRLRPNELDRITQIQSNLTQAISVIKQTPPADFLPPDASRDVNTPATPTTGSTT